MAYENSGGWLNYFVPDAAAPIIVIDIGAASANAGELSCVKPCVIKQVQFHVTDELAGGTSVAPQVILTKRPTPNSASGETVIATLTIPDATAVGKVVYKDVNVEMSVGDVIEVSHVVGTGTPTGQGIVAAVCYDRNEEPGNNTDMIASA